MSNKAKIREDALKLNIIDDAMFTKVAEDKAFCEELLRTILMDKELVVLENIPQAKIQNLQGRSVILDAKCTLGSGKIAEVEVQSADNDDHQRRVRYNSSVLTANIMDPGKHFRDVPDVIVIYISKFDVFNQNRTIYHVNRLIAETNTIIENGLQEIYVNTVIDDDSDIAILMKMLAEDGFYDKRFPATSKQKHIFKTTEGGIKIMCDIIERNRQEAAKEATKKAIKETNITSLRNLMKNMKLNAKQAMDALGIPENERVMYTNAL